jgi:hypothetical protein
VQNSFLFQYGSKRPPAYPTGGVAIEKNGESAVLFADFQHLKTAQKLESKPLSGIRLTPG